MRDTREMSVEVPESADAVFDAFLGVFQSTKSCKILAVHCEGRRLVIREKPWYSNPRFTLVAVDESGPGSQFHVVVGADPRTPAAILDGRLNARALTKLLVRVRAAVDGSEPAPASPVDNYYLQKKTQVPWVDVEQPPEIELGGNVLAMYGL
ncbi:hypothetical protein [Nocardioides albertanoniae]|uniref:hypothetical protein n=1 Tax=Nocardioides albertanoniae TaxID=1175486 RepID=UPI00115043CC|nr:hypothetical protein [Nocardioides albertanoniae]